MKTNILNLISVVLLLLFIGGSCQKDEIEYADESIVVSNQPGISVYKTNGNYIDYVSLELLPDGRLNKLPGNTLKDLIDEKGEIKRFRWRLKSGYVVGGEYERDVFTDITFLEYAKYNTDNNTAIWPHDLVKSRIIDTDPFIEFYHMGCLDCKVKEFTLGEINDMLEDGTIEEHFNKLK